MGWERQGWSQGYQLGGCYSNSLQNDRGFAGQKQADDKAVGRGSQRAYGAMPVAQRVIPLDTSLPPSGFSGGSRFALEATWYSSVLNNFYLAIKQLVRMKHKYLILCEKQSSLFTWGVCVCMCLCTPV